ncbi:hypothetical protein Ddc_23801 [Ditylenchus destructor]|nr:hypothetical protein Ddc_23801 [Ditylenchus destructor]
MRSRRALRQGVVLAVAVREELVALIVRRLVDQSEDTACLPRFKRVMKFDGEVFLLVEDPVKAVVFPRHLASIGVAMSWETKRRIFSGNMGFSPLGDELFNGSLGLQEDGPNLIEARPGLERANGGPARPLKERLDLGELCKKLVGLHVCGRNAQVGPPDLLQAVEGRRMATVDQVAMYAVDHQQAFAQQGCAIDAASLCQQRASFSAYALGDADRMQHLADRDEQTDEGRDAADVAQPVEGVHVSEDLSVVAIRHPHDASADRRIGDPDPVLFEQFHPSTSRQTWRGGDEL